MHTFTCLLPKNISSSSGLPFRRRVHQYCILPFGLSLAHVCRVPLFPCSVKDKLVLLYLDDWLLIAHSSQTIKSCDCPGASTGQRVPSLLSVEFYRHEPRFQADLGLSNSSQRACHQRHPCTGLQGLSLALLDPTSPCKDSSYSKISCETWASASVFSSALAKTQVALTSMAQVYACLYFRVASGHYCHGISLLLHGVPLDPTPPPIWWEMMTDISVIGWGDVWAS